MEQYFSGLQLYTLAKKKADELGLANQKMKMDQLICKVQEAEGNICCFRRRQTCNQLLCCWQASCTAMMVEN